MTPAEPVVRRADGGAPGIDSSAVPAPEQPPRRGTVAGSARAVARLARGVVHALRGLAIVVVRFPGLEVAARQAEVGRWSAGQLAALGIGLQVEGTRPAPGTLVVANHVSWLDIAAIHAVVPEARFVSKAAIGRWPVVGRLAGAAGTLYLERERKRDALRVVRLIGEALAAGRTVAVFPEGTTSDGHALLPFHANLLQAAITVGAPVQPVALRFSDAFGPVSDAVEFVGRTTLARSLWRVASAERLAVRLTLLPPIATAGGIDRRALASELRDRIAARLAA